ncbi:MAG: hypothetical protein IJI14_17995 [Anaerolineaceae bacterium]|nr:hypothetical protein [Anaerolineaceae bacterium]
MDGILQQLTQIIKNNNTIPEKDAEISALKEIIFSGLNRSGLFKSYFYLKKFDFQYEKTFYLCFLNQNGKDSINTAEYVQYIEIELRAAGINGTVQNSSQGINITADGINIFLFVINEDFDLNPLYLYQQAPVPYELRYISDMSEGVRGKIEKIIDLEIKSEKSEIKKKGTSKAPRKNKKGKNENPAVQQLSLFDF